MLEVYFGNDTTEVRAAALRAAGSSYTLIARESYEKGVIADAVESVSLFGGPEVFVLDTPSEQVDLALECEELLPDMATSLHTFVVIEKQLLAAPKKKFLKHTEMVEEFSKKAAERFNPFTLTEALLTKDKKNLWLLLQQARAAGLSNEELIGSLWWQLKTMRLVALTNSADEAGMKEYPYSKTKRSAGNFSPEDLFRLMSSLLTMYHEGHAGETDLEVALEQWCLGV